MYHLPSKGQAFPSTALSSPSELLLWWLRKNLSPCPLDWTEHELAKSFWQEPGSKLTGWSSLKCASFTKRERGSGSTKEKCRFQSHGLRISDLEPFTIRIIGKKSKYSHGVLQNMSLYSRLHSLGIKSCLKLVWYIIKSWGANKNGMGIWGSERLSWLAEPD